MSGMKLHRQKSGLYKFEKKRSKEAEKSAKKHTKAAKKAAK